MERVYTTDKFSGAFGFKNTKGTIVQGEFSFNGTLSVGPSPVPGAWEFVTMVGNGSAINLPASFIKYGGDDISTTLGAKNHFQAFYAEDNKIFWTNKVV